MHSVGKLAEDIAAEEVGFPQPGLWARIIDAASTGDGHFTFQAFDNYNKKSHTRDAVTRVGFVKQVTTPSGVLYALSAFSDVPLTDSWSGRACSPAYDTLCSISYARKVLGATATAMLRAEPVRATTAREKQVLGW